MPNYPQLPESWPRPQPSEEYRRRARERVSKRRAKKVSQEVADILSMRKGKALRSLMSMKAE